MFVSDLCLRALPQPGEWCLTAPLVWQEPGLRIVVPDSFVTDLASIPSVLQGVLSVVGCSRRAAVVHDFSYCLQALPRAACDQLLLRALTAEGMSAAEARIYWAGVRMGGWKPWGERPGPGLLLEDFADIKSYVTAMAVVPNLRAPRS